MVAMKIELTDELRALGICESDLPEEMSLEEALARFRALSGVVPAGIIPHLSHAEWQAALSEGGPIAADARDQRAIRGR